MKFAVRFTVLKTIIDDSPYPYDYIHFHLKQCMKELRDAATGYAWSEITVTLVLAEDEE